MKKASGRRKLSVIERLPQEVLREVDGMILGDDRSPKFYDEIVSWLEGKGYRTSRSGVGRYALRLRLDKGGISSKVAERRVREVLTELVDLFFHIVEEKGKEKKSQP